MLDIESIEKTPNVVGLHLIEVTPKALRDLANALEQRAQSSERFDVILGEVTDSVGVVYRPERASLAPSVDTNIKESQLQ